MFGRSKNQPRPSPPQPRVRRSPAADGRAAGPRPAFSYYAARSQSEINTGRDAPANKPPLRRLPTRLQRLRQHAGWLALAAIALGAAAYSLQLSSTPRVVVLADTSQTPFLQPAATYAAAAHDMFDTSAANRNKLTIDSTAIANRLERQFPELQEVSVSAPLLGNRPTVYVRPAAPALILAAANGTFVIDENGRALAEVSAANNPENLDIPTVTDQSALQVSLGGQVLPSSVSGFVMDIVRQFTAKDIAIQSMTLPAVAGELDVYVAGKPYFMKFNIQEAGREAGLRQIGTGLALLEKLRKEGVQPGQYIDVRAEGRAYYL